jgi:hypothetical protein
MEKQAGQNPVLMRPPTGNSCRPSGSGRVLMAMLSARQNARQKAEARQRQKSTASAKRPPKISVVYASGCEWNCCHDVHRNVLLPHGESNTKASDDSCDN